MTENELAKIAINAALEVHRELGPGLLESIYEEAMWFELAELRGLFVERQKPIPVSFKGHQMGLGFRADLILEKKLVLELKSVETVLPKHHKILLSYLRLTDTRLGLLLNFNEALMKQGIKRIVNGL
jgi:GxxExxY protein